MDKFTNRLKYYLIGFGLGCLMVWKIFYTGEDARPSWLPEGRVLDFLEQTTLKTTDKAACLLLCNKLSLKDFDAVFFKHATVNFTESATEKKPCPEYKIIGTLKNGDKITVFIETCDEKEGEATLRDFIPKTQNKNCNCN